MKSRFSIILDSILISLLLTFVVYVWIFRLTKNAILSVLLCIFISFLISFFYFKIKNNKNTALKSSKLDSKIFNNCFNYITYMDKKSLSKFYSKLLNSNQVVDSIFKNKFCIFYINLQEKLTEHDFFVANTYYKENNFSEPLLFISKSYSEDFLNLLNSSNYKIVSFEEVFSVMKNCNIYPEGFSITQSKTTTTSSRHKIFFNKLFKNFSRSHFKHFFISGLSLLIFSIFTFYSLYYLLFGSFLILISFVSLFLKSKVEEIKPINLNSFIKKEE